VSAALRLERDGAIARITIDRPDAANTVNLALATDFRDTVKSFSDDVRVIVIAGSGDTFCGGGDIREVAAAMDPPAHIELLARTFHEALLALDATDAVTIAEVGGAVAGGGLGLVLHADVIIASERARFLTAYERIGLTPDSGVTDLLPRTIGLHRALALTVLGRELDATTAQEWGLVAEVVRPDELHAKVATIAARIAKMPSTHVARTSRLLREVVTGHSNRLEVEAATIGRFGAEPMARDALAQFTRQGRTA
jgi:2-(1,2-epoxy-1,2-dihydrophenyl)acetyl-CoA isomerase